jgi:hypothetical protein
MKRILTLTLATIFSAALVGCHAEAQVDKPDSASSDSSMKKTTTYDRNGDRTTKIETKTSN